MVDREDGTGAGFNGVLDAAEEKVVLAPIQTGTGTSGVSGQVDNVNQCRTGRNKCSENAVCKDMPDELNENNETVGKSLSIINDIYMSWTSKIKLKPCTTVDARLDSRVMDSLAKLLNKNHAEMTLEQNFKRLKSKISKILLVLLVIML